MKIANNIPKMNRLSFTSLLHVLALSCGLVVAVSASHTERQLRPDPLEKGWEKEQELAELLNDMIEESKSTSPTLSPIVSQNKSGRFRILAIMTLFDDIHTLILLLSFFFTTLDAKPNNESNSDTITLITAI